MDKFVLAAGTKEGKLIDKKVIKTRGPETMEDVINFFKDKNKQPWYGCFGPLRAKQIHLCGYIYSKKMGQL